MSKVIIIAGIIAVIAVIFVVFFKSGKNGKSLAQRIGKRIAELFAALTPHVVNCLYFSDIVDWLKERQQLKTQSSDNIAFSLLKRQEDGKTEVCIGIFNTKTNALLEGIKYTVERLDPELTRVHNGKELVIYE
jgi:cellobiose-specific phosphotransferase system component IIC